MLNKDLLLSSYDFELPPELIAQRPLKNRDESRLLVYQKKSGRVLHQHFCDLVDLLPANSLLVLNRSRVIPCRLKGNKSSGGQAELFLLSLIPENNLYRVLINCRGKKKIGDSFCLAENLLASIAQINNDGSFAVNFNQSDLLSVLLKHGMVPIPPYIRQGMSDQQDVEDYQTVYAKEAGSVAAPTAGLHFTPKLLEKLRGRGVEVAFVTLHVGMGTFAPVKSENILEHKMHNEEYFVDQENLHKINSTNRPIVAVGTTSLRVLQSMYQQEIEANKLYQTDLFLYPGAKLREISGLITNFHLPKSTLLMLVSSLIGRQKVLELYREAIDLRYRFFSYGDAMFCDLK